MSLLKSTGNPDIDKVHEKLVADMQIIIAESNNGSTVSDLKTKLESLYELAENHFEEEEELMHEIEYPFTPTHIMAHEDILSKIRSFQQVLDHSKKDYSLLIQTLLKILEKHVEHYDVSLFTFNAQLLEKRGQTGEGATSSLPS